MVQNGAPVPEFVLRSEVEVRALAFHPQLDILYAGYAVTAASCVLVLQPPAVWMLSWVAQALGAAGMAVASYVYGPASIAGHYRFKGASFTSALLCDSLLEAVGIPEPMTDCAYMQLT